jgi:hypothetical protein
MKKKPKKYAEGGLRGVAENAESLMGEVDGMADTQLRLFYINWR